MAAIALLVTSCLSSTPLEGLGGERTRASAVNEHGVIVGRHSDLNTNVGFIFDPNSGVISSVPGLNDGPGEALDVNDQGLVVGFSFAFMLPCLFPGCPAPIDHAFLYDSTSGLLEDLADFGVGAPPTGSGLFPVGSTATGVNEAGIVVGTATFAGPPFLPGGFPTVTTRAFAFDSVTDTVTDLGIHGLKSAADVNENGQVLGQVGTHAVVLDLATGVATEIGTFGGTTSQGEALNDEGLVVGWAQVTGNTAAHAFVYDMATGVSHDIGTLPAPGAPNSFAFGVNNDGLVVGTSSASGGLHPFAYDVPTKSIKDLGVLGSSNMVEARDINDAGLAVGFSGATEAWRTTVFRHY